MSYWIFIASNHKAEGIQFKAEDIFKKRMSEKIWGLGEKTPNRKNIQKGDKVIFYLAFPKTVFAGQAIIKNSPKKIDDMIQKKYNFGTASINSDYIVDLDEINIWNNSIPAQTLTDQFEFIENKQYWFTYFQGGVRQITENDYYLIISGLKKDLVEQIVGQPDLESQSVFALESHLEEFIFDNWDHVDWGEPLILYNTEEQNGRQFPAGIWSIDFLAINKNTNDLVVIELKRGKTSDATVGQTLRYISWIKENIAEEKQNVKGIIVAKDVDDSLKYSLKGLSNIHVKTYQVEFKLNKVI